MCSQCDIENHPPEAGDNEVVTESNRIAQMQRERGDSLANLYIADELVKMRRSLSLLKSQKEEMEKAIMANWDSHRHAEHPLDGGYFACHFCGQTNEKRELVEHQPSCIVLSLGKE